MAPFPNEGCLHRWCTFTEWFYGERGTAGNGYGPLSIPDPIPNQDPPQAQQNTQQQQPQAQQPQNQTTLSLGGVKS